MVEPPLALAEAARKVLDTLAAVAPPSFLEIAVTRLDARRLCSSESFAQAIATAAGKRIPPLRFVSLDVALKGWGVDNTRFIVTAIKQP